MKRIVLCLLAAVFASCIYAQLKVYNEGLNPGIRHNDDYTVRVRVPGGEWHDLYEYTVMVDMDDVQPASMVQFDMGSPVEVMVKKNNGTINDVAIRPLSKEVKHEVKHNAILFTLNEPRYLSIEFNGDRLRNLHLFANPLETEVYTESSPGVMYFGPGIHRPDDLPNVEIQVPSNTTVYLAPGAILKAKLLVNKAENVRIIGRGILHNTIRGVEVTHSDNVTIDGITVINPDHYTVFGGESTNLTIRNLKSFSCKGWSDGINLMSCRKVLAENIFMRNSDDCIAIYGRRWHYSGDTRDITVRNSVLWADIAHPIHIGLHGDTETEGETIEKLRFNNIDILEHDEDDHNYQGCMAICAGDKNLVRDVAFEDIRVESIQEGQLFHLRVVYNEKYNTAPGRGIENVHFKNISYNGIGENPSYIKGLDNAHKIKSIIFENVKLNGRKAQSAKDMNLHIGDAVEDLTFK